MRCICNQAQSLTEHAPVRHKVRPLRWDLLKMEFSAGYFYESYSDCQDELRFCPKIWQKLSGSKRLLRKHLRNPTTNEMTVTGY